MVEYENKYWNLGCENIAGIDEAGRGPLAGPVIATSVIFSKYTNIEGIKDSKKLSEKKRNALYEIIYKNSKSIGIGEVDVKIIDKINILQATFLAMRQSIGNLKIKPDKILVDGNRADIKHYDQENIIKGDSKSISIASASIISKVYRDNLMKQYDKIFPEYGFINHNGYGTRLHLEKLKKFGPSIIHRKSFKPIKSLKVSKIKNKNMIAQNFALILNKKKTIIHIDYNSKIINNSIIICKSNHCYDITIICSEDHNHKKITPQLNNEIINQYKLNNINNIKYHLIIPKITDSKINFSLIKSETF